MTPDAPMKKRIKSRPPIASALPTDYATLCREHSTTADRADRFALVIDLITDYEAATEKKTKPLPPAKRFAALLDAHSMTAADFGRLLGLEPSMGSKIINGTRQLTAAHIRKLSAHFALSAEFFL